MAAPDPFAPTYKEAPFWWEAAPRPDLAPKPLPEQADIVIVGSGITGLNAAIGLARAGRQVAVLDAGDAGAGASSRNAGFVGRSLKHEFGSLLRRHGAERAVEVYREMQGAFDAVGEVVAQEGIDCQFKRCGRLVLAASPRQLEALSRELALKAEHLGDAYTLLPRHELPAEIASDAFAGGAVIPDLGALHPGLYHLGLLAAAQRLGVEVLTRTRVTGLRAGAHGTTVATEGGEIRGREVVVATNGYGLPGVPQWFRRRVVPFDAYMIATEALPEETVRALLPTDRTYIDSNHNIIYLRRSPDHRHVLFGGRTGSRMSSLAAMARTLHGLASRILPGLSGLRIGYAWTGRCAGTFDLYPHTGRREGIWFAGGYCFAGVPMGTYLGRKLAWRILGDPRGATVFAGRPFPTMPFYGGTPWFVPHVMRAYDWLDARAGRGGPGPRTDGHGSPKAASREAA